MHGYEIEVHTAAAIVRAQTTDMATLRLELAAPPHTEETVRIPRLPEPFLKDNNRFYIGIGSTDPDKVCTISFNGQPAHSFKDVDLQAFEGTGSVQGYRNQKPGKLHAQKVFRVRVNCRIQIEQYQRSE